MLDKNKNLQGIISLDLHVAFDYCITCSYLKSTYRYNINIYKNKKLTDI